MKKLMFLAMVLTLAGCGSTYEFGHEPGQIHDPEASTLFVGNKATLKLRDGRVLDGQVKKLSDSTLEFLEYEQYTRVIVSKKEVHSVSMNGDWTWPSVIGTVAGATLGGCIGSSAENKDRGPLDVINEHTVGISVGVILGASVGWALGYAIAPKTIIMFPAPRIVDTVRLPGREVKLDRTANGVEVTASRRAFHAAGLELK
jgi:hypothetical protein